MFSPGSFVAGIAGTDWRGRARQKGRGEYFVTVGRTWYSTVGHQGGYGECASATVDERRDVCGAGLGVLPRDVFTSERVGLAGWPDRPATIPVGCPL